MLTILFPTPEATAIVLGVSRAKTRWLIELGFKQGLNGKAGQSRKDAASTGGVSALAKQNTVEQPIMESTISVPAHERRLFPIMIDRNRMANPELDGSFSSQGGVGGNIRVMVIGQTGIVYDSDRTTDGTLRLPLPAGVYQLVLDNSCSAMFARSVSGDIKLHYVR